VSIKKPSLIVFVDGLVVFQSYGNWLHPLFEVEEYMIKHPIDMKRAYLHDKVVGKAAALLMIRLGVSNVHGDLMSELAINAFKRYCIPYSFDQAVDQIQCQTELILTTINDPEEAYQILCKRAHRC
jgi:zinc transport system ATP-binding protein